MRLPSSTPKQRDRGGADTEQPQLPPYVFIDSAPAWQACFERLRKARRIAVDLESNSLYAYRDTVCLVQLSTEHEDVILDPLAGLPLDGLGTLLADPRIEKVFHASEYDLILLKREHGWDAVNLFDTMWAARILGYERMGLAWFLQEHFGFEQRKRFQKTNWQKRPLSGGQLAYAQADTHFLLPLRDRLEDELRGRGLLDEAREIFAEAAFVRVPARDFDPEGYWSLRGARDLPPRGLAILKELFRFRDEEARRRNAPPFKVLSNQVLVSLARTEPRTLAAMEAAPGMAPSMVARWGRQLLAAIAAGKKAPHPERPRPERRVTQDVFERYDKLLQWRKSRAQARGVESDVILPRETLWDLARHRPDSLDALAQLTLMGPIRFERYARDILDQLK